MKLPISWLRDWIDVDATADEIGDLMTRRGFYIEGIEHYGHTFPGVVVARVLEVQRHPNADRLSLCRVDGGQGEVHVVCGAPNVRAGMIAPLATVGAELPNGLTIKKSKIRGEVSHGMLCSPDELGLSDEHDGILDLATMAAGDLEVGQPLAKLFGPPDAVLEIEIPFNRPDGLGVIGLAREVKAGLRGRWTDAAHQRLSNRWPGAKGFDLELIDREGCPRYIAQAIEGVTIGPSPAWLRKRLEAAGQRSLNNVVDITNLVLFEYGQPLHAFDLDKLEGPAIRVRRAQPQETIVTLDGKSHPLTDEILVIADRNVPVAVAGVMGGADSEVTAASTRLLLECAWFQPRRIRRGAAALGLSTEASKRFERGVDPQIGPAATARYLELLLEVCPRLKLIEGHESNLIPGNTRTLELRTSRCTRLIGMPVEASEAKAELEALEFGVNGGQTMQVDVPSWRPDVTHEVDLIEEVARSIGYDRIPDAPLETKGAHAERSPRERLTENARRAMLACGLTEAWCTTLISEREAVEAAPMLDAGEPQLVRLSNPMSRESEVLRPNPIPGLLRACAHNLRQGSPVVRLFEIGTGFRWPQPAVPTGLPEERSMLAALVTGPRYAHAHDASQQLVDFDDAKGIWEAWLEEMRVDTPEWRTYSAEGWKPGASAEVVSGSSRIGWTGTLSPSLLREWEIEAQVHVMVILLDALSGVISDPSVSLPGRFPPVRRDLAFFVPESVTHLELERVLTGKAGEWLRSIELFDVYTGPGTPRGMKSMAYGLRFQNSERTLTESEVQTIQDRMVAAVAKECGGELREK